jgi:exopolyphosphatase/guanosine-5'-triphosphate,3'-diphosphate pyrophosphatase
MPAAVDSWAVMDIGTNSVRLLIATVSEGRIVTLHRELVTARLGQGMRNTILPEAAERTLAALRQFKRSIQNTVSSERVQIRLVGTQFLREADNAREFQKRVAEELGWDLEILSGYREAWLSYLGATNSLSAKRGGTGSGNATVWAVLDIGGGSTEIMLPDGDGKPAGVSVPIGALRLYEQPMTPDEIQSYLREKWRDIPFPETFALVGVAGTCTTLGAVHLGMKRYDAERLSGMEMSRAQIEAVQNQILPMTSAQRAEIPGMTPGREDIIPCGIGLLLEIMRFLRRDRLIIQDADLLHGLILA